MKEIEHIFNKDNFSHHVYGIESHGLRPYDFDKFINKERFSYMFQRHYNFLKIDDVRKIKSLAFEKTEKEALFIISFIQTNKESQNALLKILEEPVANTIFFFIFPQKKNLLATLLSRMEFIKLTQKEEKKKRVFSVDDFLAMSLSERFSFIKEHTKKNKKEEEVTYFSKEDILFFLDDLEFFFSQKKANQKRNKILESILKARSHIYTNGASIKMILDMLALSILE